MFGVKQKLRQRESILQYTKLEAYLQHIETSSRQVTLAEIERYRPVETPDADSPAYECKYNSLLETLMRSFSLQQLRRFQKLYSLSTPVRRNKWHYARAIVENAWKWPSPQTVKDAEEVYRNINHRSFPLNMRQAFLLLGKDGADLLALSTKYDVHVSLTANPLSLKAEGLQASLDDLSRYIDLFKSNISETSFSLPAGQRISSEALRRISRLSGVFLEEAENGFIRLCHTTTQETAVRFSKRLILLALFEVTGKVPIYLYTKGNDLSSDTNCSYFPIYLPHLLPHFTEKASFFRVRRVRRRSSTTYTPAREVGLSVYDKVIDARGELASLRDILLKAVENMNRFVPGCVISTTASFGHILASSSISSLDEQGPLNACDVFSPQSSDWLFVACATAGDSTWEATEPPTCRLVYRRLHIQDQGENLMPGQVLKFDLVSNETGTSELESACWIGPSVELDLLMPDYALDMRFSVFGGTPLERKYWPREMQDYIDNVEPHSLTAAAIQKQDPPLVLTHQGIPYGLQTHYLTRSLKKQATDLYHTLSEGVFNPGSEHQMSPTFQVTCRDTKDMALFLAICNDFAASRTN